MTTTSQPYHIALDGGTIATTRHAPAQVSNTTSALWLLLHGFGEDRTTLDGSAATLSAKGDIAYTIDLPFHGETVWHTDFFTPTDLLTAFAHLETRESEDMATANKPILHLIGFSFGGHIILSLLPHIATAHRIGQVLLAAPGGTPPIFATLLYAPPTWAKRVVTSGLRLLRPLVWGIVMICHQLRLTRPITHQILEPILGTPHPDPRQMQQLLGTWYSLSYFSMHWREARRTLHTHPNITLSFIFGKRDRVLWRGAAEWLIQHFPTQPVVWVEGGHRAARLAIETWVRGG